MRMAVIVLTALCLVVGCRKMQNRVDKLGSENQALRAAWAEEQKKLMDTNDPKVLEEIKERKKQLFQALSENLKEIAKLTAEEREALNKKFKPANSRFEPAP